jgi:hypothetical protein
MTEAEFIANLAVLQTLVDDGVIVVHRRGHQPPGCDYMLTCDCPPPIWAVAPAYRAALGDAA